jgi:hypothetical protein
MKVALLMLKSLMPPSKAEEKDLMTILRMLENN